VQDIGRYEASNFGLLKTVLQINLELFARNRQQQKTVLMFLVRDWTELDTPLSKQQTRHTAVGYKEVTEFQFVFIRLPSLRGAKG